MKKTKPSFSKILSGAVAAFIVLSAAAGPAAIFADQTAPQPPVVKVGLFGIGLDTYWGQFAGLKDRLEGYRRLIQEKLAAAGAEVVSAGLVDSVDKAREAAALFKTLDVRVLFLYVSTYALSSTVLPVVRETGLPVIVLNLQPARAIDYARFNARGDRGKMTGEWLAFCQACSIPEIASVFNRAAVPFRQITGTLDDSEAWAEIGAWVEAARTAEVLAGSRLGILGLYYNGMLDVYTDPTLVSASFGTVVEHLEIGDLKVRRDKAAKAEIAAKVREIRDAFDVLQECAPAEIERAARTACALDRLVADKRLGALAYYYEGTPGGDEEDIVTSVIAGTSLLTARHVPVAGECEIKNAMAMKIMDAFGAGGSFREFYAMDFDESVILMGHDGPGHIAIAEGKPILKPLGVFHGKPGKGLSVEMKVKTGPVTLLAVVQTREGRLKLLAAEGEAVPGPILEIGNTNSRYKFPLGVKGFIEAWSREGPAHHCAIGVGHIASKIEKLASLLGLEFKRV
ncbi:MAG: arabinose isomerase [Candidatus Aminicenantes bacterium]|nr:arabinose isomerase [Candidatus Aminicenantes bacterium]